jgi:hypothetical protein
MFCAAIPTAAAVGAKLNADQQKQAREAIETGAEKPSEKPIAALTVGAVVLLVAGSVIYHSTVYS